MLYDIFKEIEKGNSKEDKEDSEGLSKLIGDIAYDIMESLDKDGSKALEWGEFKHFMEEFSEREGALRDYIQIKSNKLF